MDNNQLENLVEKEIKTFEKFKESESKKLIEKAKEENNKNHLNNISRFFDTKKIINEKLKKVAETMKIRECLEYLR